MPERLVAVLRAGDDLGMAELQELLGASVDAIYAAVSRARQSGHCIRCSGGCYTLEETEAS
jgi:DNA-directed RNA polymerase specialized sigma24 family protein